MKWNKFRIKTTTEAEDIVCSSLMDLGVQGVEVEEQDSAYPEREGADVCGHPAGDRCG